MAWVVAGLSAFPYFLFTTINYVDRPLGSGDYLEDSAFCALLDINITPQVRQRNKSKDMFSAGLYLISRPFNTLLQGYPMHELSFLTFFLLPSAILLFLYISMGVSLRGSIRKNSSLAHAGSVHGDTHLNSHKKQIIRMLGERGR